MAACSTSTTSFGFAPAAPSPIFKTRVPAAHKTPDEELDGRMPNEANEQALYDPPSPFIISHDRRDDDDVPELAAPVKARSKSRARPSTARTSGNAQAGPSRSVSLSTRTAPAKKSSSATKRKASEVGVHVAGPSKKVAVAAPPSQEEEEEEEHKEEPGTGAHRPWLPKRFPCPKAGCDRFFARNYNLQAHIATHKNIRDFACPECGKMFSRRHDCTRHCVAVHNHDRELGKQEVVRVTPGREPPKKPGVVPKQTMASKASKAKARATAGSTTSTSASTSAGTKKRSVAPPASAGSVKPPSGTVAGMSRSKGKGKQASSSKGKEVAVKVNATKSTTSRKKNVSGSGGDGGVPRGLAKSAKEGASAETSRRRSNAPASVSPRRSEGVETEEVPRHVQELLLRQKIFEDQKRYDAMQKIKTRYEPA